MFFFPNQATATVRMWTDKFSESYLAVIRYNPDVCAACAPYRGAEMRRECPLTAPLGLSQPSYNLDKVHGIFYS